MTTKKAVVTAKRLPAKRAPIRAKPAVKAKAGVVPEPIDKKSKKEHKVKVVRDSFTMPQSEYLQIAEIKGICLEAKMHVKKSEVLRAGLKVLAALNAVQLKRALGGLEKIKTGRPKKH